MNTNNELEKKPRKVTSGPVRDKARTMARMVASVGSVLLKHGYCGLTTKNIIKEAKVDRKLLQVHFGGLEQLIEAYVKQKTLVLTALKDDWESRIDGRKITVGQFADLIQWFFGELYNDKELVKVIHWELGGNNNLLGAFSDARQELEGVIKQYALRVHKGGDKKNQPGLSLLLGSMYYLLMQSVSSDPAFKDNSTAENESGIEDALSKLVDFVLGN